jgi:Protein of unknown function (DUF3619)
MTARLNIVEFDALQSRFAVRVAADLKLRANALPHDISERLRVAREQVVASARQEQVRLATSPSVVSRSAGGAATLAAPSPWWLKLASGFPLAVLLVGLVVIAQWNSREQVLAAAEVDMQLLSDDLPPKAYSDPGFAEFLRNTPP